MRTRNWILLGGLGLALAFGFMALQLRGTDALPPLPHPNGYDEFLKAGELLAPDSPKVEDLTDEALRSFVARNAAAVRKAREGLQMECRVPIRFTQEYQTNRMDELAHWKGLVRAFVAEGKLAERENRPRAAVASYLDAMRFSHQCARGGLIIDAMVGVAGQSLAGQALQGVSSQLAPADRQAAIRQLEEMEAKAEPAQAVLEQERIWRRRSFGLPSQFAGWMMRRSLRQIEESFVAKTKDHRQRMSLVLAKLREGEDDPKVHQ